MAKCDEGYICHVCGKDVASITESDLYLRYVIGMIDPEILHTTPERHIKCNPSLAQFIESPDFPAVVIDDEYDKRKLDPEFCRERVELVTRGWERLKQLKESDNLSMLEYPLPEFRQVQ